MLGLRRDQYPDAQDRKRLRRRPQERIAPGRRRRRAGLPGRRPAWDASSPPSRNPTAAASSASRSSTASRDLLRTAAAERAQTTQADAERAAGGPAPQRKRPNRRAARTPACAARRRLLRRPGGRRNPGQIPADLHRRDGNLARTNLARPSWRRSRRQAGGHRNLLIVSHRIKGSAASIGLNRPAKFAHLMEDLVAATVDTGGTLSATSSTPCWPAPTACDSTSKGSSRASRRSAALGRFAAKTCSRRRASAGRRSGARGQRRTAGLAASSMPGRRRRPADRKAYAGGRGLFQPELPLVGLKARLIYEKLARPARCASSSRPRSSSTKSRDCGRSPSASSRPSRRKPSASGCRLRA